MDTVKIKGGFATGIIARWFMKQIKRSLGYDVKLKLEEFELYVDENDIAHFHVNVTGEADSETVKKMVDDI